MKALLLIVALISTLAVMTNGMESRPNGYTSGVSVICNDICK